jgi:hypothetical protein
MTLKRVAAQNERIAQEKYALLGLDELKDKKPNVVSITPKYCPQQGFKIYVAQSHRFENIGTWISGDVASKWKASGISLLRNFLLKNPAPVKNEVRESCIPEFNTKGVFFRAAVYGRE